MGTPMPSAVPTPTSLPTPTAAPSPVPAPLTGSCVPIGDCSSFAWCNQDALVVHCASAVTSCPLPFCTTSASTAPVPMPTPELLAPTPAPAGASDCVPEDNCSANPTLCAEASDFIAWCAAASAAGTCPVPLCKWA